MRQGFTDGYLLPLKRGKDLLKSLTRRPCIACLDIATIKLSNRYRVAVMPGTTTLKDVVTALAALNISPDKRGLPAAVKTVLRPFMQVF
ncbi:hypothetical protein [Megasphaera massiliensis]|uniref:hypothetical protein n=1 Tax=Megasphaera massiliensis TaxID=1232428 RepID=UPI00079C3932|nr:hypothetical protein [Megasphaera massiliensis]KXA69770.1 hypothetical protein HMPREF3201_00757 [Megasphaera sp. MJR8396C]